MMVTGTKIINNCVLMLAQNIIHIISEREENWLLLLLVYAIFRREKNFQLA